MAEYGMADAGRLVDAVAGFEAHLADETLSWEHTFRVARPQGEGVCWVKVRAMKSYLEQPGGKRKSYISGAIADVTLEEGGHRRGQARRLPGET